MHILAPQFAIIRIKKLVLKSQILYLSTLHQIPIKKRWVFKSQIPWDTTALSAYRFKNHTLNNSPNYCFSMWASRPAERLLHVVAFNLITFALRNSSTILMSSSMFRNFWMLKTPNQGH